MTNNGQRELDPLSVLLHQQVDDVQLHGTGWPQISRRIHRRRTLTRVAVPATAVGLAAAGVLGTTLPALVQGDGAVRTTVQASGRSRPTPVEQAADAALAFAAAAGAGSDGLRAELPASGGDSTHVELRRGDGALVSEVVLAPPAAGSTWQVTSTSSPAVTVMSPKAGDSFDPPLFVAFRTSKDAEVTVTLLADGRPEPLATWTDQVDAHTDWYANLNYPIQAPRTRGLIVLTSRTDGHLAALAAIPVQISSGG